MHTYGGFMKRSFALGAALAMAVTGLGITQPAHAAGGGESIAVSSMGRVTMTVGDGTFDGNNARIPIKFTYEKWGEDYGDVAISVTNLRGRQVGASSDIGFASNSVDSIFWPFNAAQKGTGDGAIDLVGSAFRPNQPVLIFGSAVFINSQTREQVEAAFQPVLFINVAQEVTTLTGVKVGPRSISGRATVESTVGTVGAGGDVWVRYRAPGDKRWTTVDDYVNCPADVCMSVDALGNFSMTTFDPIPAGARVEVSIVGCGWCTEARQTVTRGKK